MLAQCSQLLLRVALGRDRARAVYGDLEEELARGREAGEPRRVGQLWILRESARHAIAVLAGAVPRIFRTSYRIVRDAMRGLKATPAVTAFSIVILTLGIAAATVTFSVVDHVVLRGLPFDAGGDLVAIRGQSERGPTQIAGVDYLSWRQLAGFESVGAYLAARPVTIDIGGASATAIAASVTSSVFDVVRVRPVIGRTFGSEHEEPGGDRVVVIGYGMWQRLFGGRSDAVGRMLTLGGQTHEIVGVMPQGFSFPIGDGTPVDVWSPHVIPADQRVVGPGRSLYLSVMARLRAPSSLEHAQAELDMAVDAAAAASPGGYRNWRAEVARFTDSLLGNVRGWMLLVLWAVGLVMLIACVNVANLLLTHAVPRSRQSAIRAALGATRRQLVATHLVESLLIALVAAGIGLAMASWGIGVVATALPAGVSRSAGIGLDARVLTVAIAGALVTAVTFGLVPALHSSRADVVTLIKDGGVSTHRSGQWRRVLLVAEIAFVAMLLVASTLFVVSFVRVTHADLGFQRANLIAADLFGLEAPRAEVIARIQAIPGVSRVAAMTNGSAPLIATGFGSGGSATTAIQSVDAPAGGAPLVAEYRSVTPGYFGTAAIPLRGRSFTDDEHAGGEVVIDELAARRLFGDVNVVGRQVLLRTFPRQVHTVVGVAANVRLAGPEQDTSMQVYMPLPAGRGNTLVIRTEHAPELVAPLIAKVVDQLGPSSRGQQVYIMDEAFRRITAGRRFNGRLMLAFGFFALVMGAAGVYGVMSSAVAQRTREIGLRVALGASRARVIQWVLTQSLRQVALGLGLGLAVALAVSRIFTGLLYGVEPTSVFVYIVVALILAVVGVVAAILPARRAARVDPVVALRQ